MYTYCNYKHAGKLIMPCQGTVNHMGGTPKQIHNCPLGWLQTGVATSTNRSLALQWLFSGTSLAPAGRAGTLDPWYHMSRMPQAETYRLYPGIIIIIIIDIIIIIIILLLLLLAQYSILYNKIKHLIHR